MCRSVQTTRIVEFLLSLPPELGRSKAVLRRVIGRLGAPRPPRRKRGFEVPLGQWIRDPLRPSLERVLFGVVARAVNLDQKYLRIIWEEHQSGKANHGERLLAAAVLVRWVEEWA